MEDLEERILLISDEIKVLDSIFCGKDEFLVDGSPPDSDIELACRNLVESKRENLQLSVQVPSHTATRLNVSLGKDYPNSSPEISLSSTQITRKTTTEMQDELQTYAKKILAQFSEPIVLKLVERLQMKLCEICPPPGETQENKESLNKDDTLYIYLLKFDHMRSRKKYLKTISSWIKELDLNGCILFLGKNIFSIIEGLKSDIIQYLKRMRTCTVDVDSGGRPCKERMMDVLCEVENTSQESIANGFQIIECTNLEEFQQIFKNHSLTDIYESHVKKLIQ